MGKLTIRTGKIPVGIRPEPCKIEVIDTDDKSLVKFMAGDFYNDLLKSGAIKRGEVFYATKTPLPDHSFKSIGETKDERS